MTERHAAIKKDRSAVLFLIVKRRAKNDAPQGNEIVRFADSGPTLITCE